MTVCTCGIEPRGATVRGHKPNCPTVQVQRDYPLLFTQDEEDGILYGLQELMPLDALAIETKLAHLNTLMGILKDEWENDMLIGDAGDLLKKLGVVT